MLAPPFWWFVEEEIVAQGGGRRGGCRVPLLPPLSGCAAKDGGKGQREEGQGQVGGHPRPSTPAFTSFGGHHHLICDEAISSQNFTLIFSLVFTFLRPISYVAFFSSK